MAEEIKVSEEDAFRLRLMFSRHYLNSEREEEALELLADPFICKCLLRVLKSPENAYYQGIQMFEARVTFGTNAISKSRYPFSIHYLSPIYTTGKDKSGNLLVWICAGIPTTPAHDIFYQYVLSRLEEVFMQARTEKRKITIVTDFMGTAIGNNFPKKFIIKAIKIYPRGILAGNYFLNVEKPSHCLTKFLNKVLPRKSITVADNDSIKQYISTDNFPDYYGGNITSIPRSIGEHEATDANSILNSIRTFMNGINLPTTAYNDIICYYTDIEKFYRYYRNIFAELGEFYF